MSEQKIPAPRTLEQHIEEGRKSGRAAGKDMPEFALRIAAEAGTDLEQSVMREIAHPEMFCFSFVGALMLGVPERLLQYACLATRRIGELEAELAQAKEGVLK